jgi:antitoxin ParD1/3/4
MTIKLSPKTQKLVKARLKSGRYASAEEVLLAGLASLTRQEQMGDFAPGELEHLVTEGEQSIHREGTVDATEVFADLRRRAQHLRRQGGGGRRREGGK